MNAITDSASSRDICRYASYGINGKSGEPSFDTPLVIARITSPSVHVLSLTGVMFGA